MNVTVIQVAPAPARLLRQARGLAWLGAALLVGLGANALAGWWWADPVTALLIAGSFAAPQRAVRA